MNTTGQVCVVQWPIHTCMWHVMCRAHYGCTPGPGSSLRGRRPSIAVVKSFGKVKNEPPGDKDTKRLQARWRPNCAESSERAYSKKIEAQQEEVVGMALAPEGQAPCLHDFNLPLAPLHQARRGVVLHHIGEVEGNDGPSHGIFETVPAGKCPLYTVRLVMHSLGCQH